MTTTSRPTGTRAPIAGGRRTERVRVMLAFGAVYGFWGGTFLATRVAVESVPPLLTIAIRCALSALLLVAWARWRGAWVRPTWGEWRTALSAGAWLFLGCQALGAWAARTVPSGQGALYLSTVPLWGMLLSAARTRRRPGGQALSGLLLGAVGLGVVAIGGGSPAGFPPRVASHATPDAMRGGVLALLLAAVSWAWGSLVARDGARPASAVQGTAMQLVGGAAVVGLAAVLRGEVASWSPARLTARAALAIGFLSVCGTGLGFAAYTWLMRVRSATLVSTYAFVNPVLAVGLAWVVGDEAFAWRTVLALGSVLAGVGLIWRAERQRPSAGASIDPPAAPQGANAPGSRVGLRWSRRAVITAPGQGC